MKTVSVLSAHQGPSFVRLVYVIQPGIPDVIVTTQCNGTELEMGP